jgi:hypothetical protein
MCYLKDLSFNGNLPSSIEKKVVKWATDNIDELNDNWERSVNNKPFLYIRVK